MQGLKIVVIGGGSSYTPELIEGIIIRYDELPVKELVMVDVRAGEEKMEIVGNLARRMFKKSGIDIDLKLTLNQQEVIKGADFVITQFRVGGLEARARDERIPLRYNQIGQETTGAGGFAKALRTIPVMMSICRDIEKYAPEAWLINFTNPAGLITETILNNTSVKAIGLCNVPIKMLKTIAKILKVEEDRVRVEFVGLNHLNWGRKVFLDGKDITDSFIEMLINGEDINMNNIPDFKWDEGLLRSLKMIPCPYHRYYYMADSMLAEEKKVAKKEGTRAEQVMKIEKKLFSIYDDPELAQKPAKLSERGGAYYSDAAVSLISSIYNNKKDIHTVNIKNNGAISNLPDDAVIEVNAFVDSTGATPLNITKVEKRILALIQLVKAYEQLAIEAGISGDYNCGIQALTINPLISSTAIAEKIMADIIKENKTFLPQFY